MSFLDYIKDFLNLNKNSTQIIVKDLNKVYGSKDALEVALYQDKVAVKSKEVIIQINGVEYKRITDDNGIAKLNIGLQPGKYYTTVSFSGDDVYKKCSGSAVVYVNPVLQVSDLNMDYGNGRFEVKTVDVNGNILVNVPVVFNVNGKDYKRVSDGNGVAGLKIGLNPGSYPVKVSSVNVMEGRTIVVNKLSTRMEGTDMVKAFSDKGSYQCAVYDSVGRVSGEVTINVNGKDYVKSADGEGLYKLGIGLAPGEYKVTAKFDGDLTHSGSSVVNTIKVNEDPVVSSKLNNYLTSTGCAGMGQCTPYYCACNSLQQCFYRLTGIQVSESTIAKVAGTTSNGTGHEGINTAVAWFNRKYDKNIKIEWHNFSDLGWDGLEKCMKNGAVFCHLKYRRTSSSAGYGHYEVPYKISGDNIKVLNSLGNRCNKPAYCGYIETRNKNTHKYYIQGISQKSVCYLYNG